MGLSLAGIRGAVMGMLHRRRVYETPPGFLTADERLVLLVLADQTPDFHEDGIRPRLEWVHKRDKLMPMLGLDPDRELDHEWLRRRLQALDEAGFITRRKQRRRKQGGTWSLPSIKLELSAIEVELVPSMVIPTRRAGPDGRARNLPDYDPDRPRDARGRFVSPAHQDGGAVSNQDGGAVSNQVGGRRPTELVGPNRTSNRTEKQDKRTGQPTAAAVGGDEEEKLAEKKRASIAALERFESRIGEDPNGASANERAAELAPGGAEDVSDRKDTPTLPNGKTTSDETDNTQPQPSEGPNS